MTKRVEKRDLPTKVCPVCGRPFTWRRTWAASWDEVRYCSERCVEKSGNVPARSSG